MRSIHELSFRGNCFKGQDFTKAVIATKRISIEDMRRKKKTTIVTFESSERTTIHRARRSLTTWCDQCAAEVLMVPPNEAALIAGKNARAIFRAVELGEIHFFEQANGALFICNKSLERAAGCP